MHSYCCLHSKPHYRCPGRCHVVLYGMIVPPILLRNRLSGPSSYTSGQGLGVHAEHMNCMYRLYVQYTRTSINLSHVHACTCAHTHAHTHTQLFSIIVFGCVADQVYQDFPNGRVCFYNFSNACSFAIAVGVIAFLLCLTFLVKDVLFVIIDYSDTIVVSWLGQLDVRI